MRGVLKSAPFFLGLQPNPAFRFLIANFTSNFTSNSNSNSRSWASAHTDQGAASRRRPLDLRAFSWGTGRYAGYNGRVSGAKVIAANSAAARYSHCGLQPAQNPARFSTSYSTSF